MERCCAKHTFLSNLLYCHRGKQVTYQRELGFGNEACQLAVQAMSVQSNLSNSSVLRQQLLHVSACLLCHVLVSTDATYFLALRCCTFDFSVGNGASDRKVVHRQHCRAQEHIRVNQASHSNICSSSPSKPISPAQSLAIV
jgi:hypothetical protein